MLWPIKNPNRVVMRLHEFQGHILSPCPLILREERKELRILQ